MATAVTILSSLEGWNAFWQVFTLIALALTFIAGSGQLLTGKWLGEKQGGEIRTQATQILKLSSALEEQREKTEEQREKTAEAEKGLLELQQMVSWRAITPANRLLFRKTVGGGGSPLGKVSVWGLSNNPEVWRFTSQIFDMLKEAGYDVGVGPGSTSTFGAPLVGITLVTAQPEKPPHFDGLRAGLAQINISVSQRVGSAPGLDANSISLQVGVKP